VDDAQAGTGSPALRQWTVPLKANVALALLFGGVVGLSLFTASYAEGTSYRSDDPAACRNCHVMNDVDGAGSRGPHHHVAMQRLAGSRPSACGGGPGNRLYSSTGFPSSSQDQASMSGGS
jgi:hypothetical protein